MSYEQKIVQRSSDTYADFLIPYLNKCDALLDAACGDGTISLGLSEYVSSVTGVDVLPEFDDALKHASQAEITNVDFQIGDLYSLDFRNAQFDACICHSALEALSRPMDALVELKRVLKKGAAMGVASVDYGGVILEAEQPKLLVEFYEVRKQLWQLEQIADPYFGRRLRSVMNAAGFSRIEATTKYICYGSSEKVKDFGVARAAECRNGWFYDSSTKHGLLTTTTLASMESAWSSWSESKSSYFAFPFCRAIGWND